MFLDAATVARQLGISTSRLRAIRREMRELEPEERQLPPAPRELKQVA